YSLAQVPGVGLSLGLLLLEGEHALLNRVVEEEQRGDVGRAPQRVADALAQPGHQVILGPVGDGEPGRGVKARVEEADQAFIQGFFSALAIGLLSALISLTSRL